MSQYGNPTLSFASATLTNDGYLSITANQWQLVGFTAYISSDKKTTEATLFSGYYSSSYVYLHNSPTELDISSASVIRIGGAIDSFSGQVSLVRMMRPGGGNVNSCNKLFIKFLSKLSF